MYLHALATAVPSATFSQSDCLQLAQQPNVHALINRRSSLILSSILRSDHGIATRHFAVTDPEHVFEYSADQLNETFRTEAPRLAGQALTSALAQIGLRPDQLDALLICTCTGYLCPGVTSYVAEQLGLRPNAFLQDLVGLGCGAAIPTLRAASHVLAANPNAIVGCVAVEICSAAFYLDDDPGVLISACLFSDGAAATIWRATPGPSGLRAFDFDTLHRPTDRDKLRFEQRQGKLRNLLHRTVPELAAGAVSELWARRGSRPVRAVVAHPGGRDVLEALAPVVAPFELTASIETLRDNGNMSSPSVLFALERTLARTDPASTGDFWLVSFGAGFSAHSCRLGPA
ncbi:chalcone and stilbene synthase domain protein [Opitutus terrae PB90-1]|uniref:Chalcone and stilbene synthase domain protein n=2 Tax=Opitutus terrae TaxID=107709 RepID=B1ZWG0_OPITP|nr:stilbene synthase [Opitutus terrae]ACB76912.1 chalcone and stilbene synthase domain protein [Opitutus terrae PB90-1]